MSAAPNLWEWRKPRRAAILLATVLTLLATSACTATPGAAEIAPTGGVDASCRVDTDCAVKNVGNCCGYYPACVNKDSPTDPARVRTECEAKGLASTCGFAEIASCTCIDGHCTAAPGGNDNVQ